jgi:hypothetical protein
MKQEDRDTLKRERAAYNQNRGRGGTQSEIQELRSQIHTLQGTTVTTEGPNDNASVSQQLHVSQLTSATHSIMGGRNEQAQHRQHRRAGAVVTLRRLCSTTPLERPWTDPIANTVVDNECDTNADTCCLGKNFIVLNATYRTADVYAYDTSTQPIENVPIVSGGTAYDDPVSGDTFILVFNESLYYGEKLDHSLINPNQLRAYGIQFWDNPFDPTHNLSIEVTSDFTIPLQPFGTKVVFRTRVPTSDKLRTCEHIHMTSSHPWNPNEVVMVQATDQGGNSRRSPWKRQLATLDTTLDTSNKRSEYIDPTSDDALLDSVHPSLARIRECNFNDPYQ